MHRFWFQSRGTDHSDAFTTTDPSEQLQLLIHLSTYNFHEHLEGTEKNRKKEERKKRLRR
jgi:hypothetical protein